MKNYIMKNYIKNRNSLRYLITNPFKEPFSYTLLKFFKENNFNIINKEEHISLKETLIKFKVKKGPNNIIIKTHISKDHLINISLIMGKKSISKTTRVIEEALLFILDNLV